MDKFSLLKAVAAPMLMSNITTDAMSPTAAQTTATDLGDAVRELARDLEGRELPIVRTSRCLSKRVLAGPTGCGSSRERGLGAAAVRVRCVIAPTRRYFYDNAFQNGLLLRPFAADCTALWPYATQARSRW
jgi:3-isopropylmalate dehydratase small subunit